MADDVVFSENGRVLTAKLACEIDHHTARRMREEIDRRLFSSKPEILVIDFGAVRFMDSSGIGLILGRLDKAQALGATVRLSGLSPTLMKLVRLSGIEKMKDLSLCR